jgi:hypothetical protein
MSGCHEPEKNTEKLVTDLKCLIQLNQNGVAKCIEWAEKFENEINSLRGQLEGLSDHIEKVHDLVNLEDRITASDVLNRLTMLETHKNYQTDENRKASKRMDEIENGYIQRIGHLGEALHCMSEENEKLRKVPHKCPVCEGCGNDKGKKIENPDYEFCMQYASCQSCEGKGVLWG